MLEKTFKIFDNLMKTMNNEVNEVFKHVKNGKQTKVKIKCGSTISINGAIVTLLNDVIVLTNNPDQLMQSKSNKH